MNRKKSLIRRITTVDPVHLHKQLHFEKFHLTLQHTQILAIMLATTIAKIKAKMII